jgi:cation diffusion facilitator CzcD-associated flavoprotein CzcO
MLQRSPTWVISRPAQDPMANWLRAKFSNKLAFHLTRWRNILLGTYIYRLCQTRPEKIKQLLLKGAREALGPDYDLSHFTPRYNPWEQRLCLVPDNDMFKAIRAGKADVVTDQIAQFTERGVKLQSGRELEADIVVTATGLVMQAYGGIDLAVDGRKVDLSQTITYKGVMISGVPNFAAVFGYINASWTLRADLICHWFCRLLNYMDQKKVCEVVAQPDNEKPAGLFVENFSSGYMQRALASWPKQGSKKPWRAYQNYLKDIATLKWAPVANRALRFSTSIAPALAASPVSLRESPR